MAIPKILDDLSIIQKLSNLPNETDGLSAESLKAAFDEAPLTIQRYVNAILLPFLESETGAQNIGISPIEDVNATDVQRALEILRGQIKQAVIGNIPDHSITDQQLATAAVLAYNLAADSVETDKIADGAVTDNKIVSVSASKVTGELGSNNFAAKSVTADKINDFAVVSSKLSIGAVVEEKIGTYAVVKDKIANGAVTETKIANGAVTSEKLASDLNFVDEAVVSNEWNSSVTYVAGNYCIYANKLWKCLVDCIGQTPSAGTYWEEVTVSNEIKDLHNSEIGTRVALTATPFVCPKDGYVWMYNTTANAYLAIGDPIVGVNIGGAAGRFACYVRKGMTVQLVGNATSAAFIPID